MTGCNAHTKTCTVKTLTHELPGTDQQSCIDRGDEITRATTSSTSSKQQEARLILHRSQHVLHTKQNRPSPACELKSVHPSPRCGRRTYHPWRNNKEINSSSLTEPKKPNNPTQPNPTHTQPKPNPVKTNFTKMKPTQLTQHKLNNTIPTKPATEKEDNIATKQKAAAARARGGGGTRYHA